MRITEHGGFIRERKRKLRRPIEPKKPLHVVIRSSKARGLKSFLHREHKGMIHLILLDVAERFGIKIYRYENVGNHIHLMIQGRRRDQIQSFLRVFPQRLMFQVTGARKGSPKGRFFDKIAYSRIVEWGREFKVMKNYLWKNAMESLGFARQDLYLWIKPEGF